MNRIRTLALALALALLGATGCVSADLARANTGHVRAQADALTGAGIAPPADAVPTAEALEDATGTLAQVFALGVDEALAAANVGHVRTMTTALDTGGIDNPAPEAEDVALELARQAGASAAAVAAARGVAGPWWLPVAGLLGAAGAAFTALKTARRVWADKHPAAPAGPAPTP